MLTSARDEGARLMDGSRATPPNVPSSPGPSSGDELALGRSTTAVRSRSQLSGGNPMDLGKRRFAILFVAPAFLLFTGLVVVPLAATIIFSFTNWSASRPMSAVGLDNYVRLAGDSRYWEVVGNSIITVAIHVFIQVPIAIALSAALYWTLRGFRAFRSSLFVPVVMAPVAIGLLFSILLNGDVGAVNAVFGAVGLENLQKSWLSDTSVVLYAVITPDVWQYVGFYVVILLAAFRGIPREYIDAASVDGASRIRILFGVMIPLIREVIVIVLILVITGSIRSFDHAWIMTRGGPGLASAFLSILVYKEGFLNLHFG